MTSNAPEPADELGLLQRAQAGDDSAFEEIVLRHQDAVYNLCRRILGDPHDAEDAAQEVFVKAYKALPGFRPEASLSTWLHRIAVNTCIDYRRRPVFEPIAGMPDENVVHYEPVSEEPSPERLAESRQTARALWLAIGRLSVKLRAAIILRELYGLSYEEIAETLDVSVGTVKSRLARARLEIIDTMKKITEQN